MTNPKPTSSTSPSFASIDDAALADVQGGCGKRRARCCCPPPAAPPAAPSGGTSVDVSVSYQ